MRQRFRWRIAILKRPEMIGSSQVEIVTDRRGGGENAFLEFGLMKNFGLVATRFENS